jgi:hypothetical protein
MLRELRWRRRVVVVHYGLLGNLHRSVVDNIAPRNVAVHRSVELLLSQNSPLVNLVAPDDIAAHFAVENLLSTACTAGR